MMFQTNPPHQFSGESAYADARAVGGAPGPDVTSLAVALLTLLAIRGAVLSLYVTW